MVTRLGQSATPSGMRIYAIGDVHGHLNLLQSLYKKIQLDLASNAVEHCKIIFLGDYIDRGPESADCVQYLIDLAAVDDRIICLKGNHEDKLERFLMKPLEMAESFFSYGGVQCAQSYGAELVSYPQTEQQIIEIHDHLVVSIPAEHTCFMSQLLMSVRQGDYLFAHAGIRPGVALDEQTETDLMTIRSEFISNEGLYEKVIVHGHTPSYPMEILPNRINVDTCAYDTGILSCVVLEDTSYRVIQA